MKITKKELDEFWAILGDDWYHDEDDLPDYDDAPPDYVFEVTCGVIMWQGKGDPVAVPGIMDPRDDRSISLPAAIRKWKKSLTTATVIVELPKDQVDKFTALLPQFKAKVVK